jgi:iron(II)-dependent oxidoreductase
VSHHEEFAVATAASAHRFREILYARLLDARRLSDSIFRVVREPAMYDRPIPERNRIIFYLGHLEAFDWNLLSQGGFDLKASQPSFDKLFAFGIDPVDGGLPTDVPSDWPSRQEVDAYVARVRSELDHAIQRAPDSAIPFSTLLHTAIEHRLMHVETLSYMLHQLPLDRKTARPATPRLNADSPPEHGAKSIQAGTATLGLKRSNGDEFGWDNEFEEHRVSVPDFAIDVHSITNRDFLEFVQRGGYEDRAVWSDDSWKWIQQARICHPVFWLSQGQDWLFRSAFAVIPLPMDWPAYVSHAEASAYARWRGKQLPTEAQFHRAAYGTPEGTERVYPWGDSAPSLKHGNFDFYSWDPEPIGSRPEGASAFGVQDLVGNGWEWTRTAFEPFHGFAPYSFYLGYSANFFDGKHFVLKGGSPRTAACMLRRSFRNWFQPHYGYVYAKFRCVEE